MMDRSFKHMRLMHLCSWVFGDGYYALFKLLPIRKTTKPQCSSTHAFQTCFICSYVSTSMCMNVCVYIYIYIHICIYICTYI